MGAPLTAVLVRSLSVCWCSLADAQTGERVVGSFVGALLSKSLLAVKQQVVIADYA